MVEKRNSHLKYRVNSGDRILQSVHVQLLKLYTPRSPEARVTTVLEPDSSTNTMEQQYAEATVMGKVVTETREANISNWEKDFADIITKEPGLTTLAQFKFETGQHPPICQGPYNTPHALRESVNKELEWLRQKENPPVVGRRPW